MRGLRIFLIDQEERKQMAQYTEKAQEALVLAGEAAEDMGSHVIGTEHILVGIIEEGSAACLFLSEHSHQRTRWLHAERETCAGKQL